MLDKVCAACLNLCLSLVLGILKPGQLNGFVSLHFNALCPWLENFSCQSFGSLHEIGTLDLELGRWQRKTCGMTVVALSEFFAKIIGLVHVGLPWNIVGGCRVGHVCAGPLLLGVYVGGVVKFHILNYF